MDNSKEGKDNGMAAMNYAAAEKALDLSIVIVSWNVEDLLRDCLMSVYAETKEHTFDVWVVDNASRDSSAKMVESEFPQAKLIKNEENLGFARANNQAIRQSRGRFVLLLNPDTAVLEGALDKMVSFMEAHPEAGALTCKIFKPDGSIQGSASTHFGSPLGGTLLAHLRCIMLLKLHKYFFQRDTPGNSLGGFLNNDSTIREVSWTLGACMMVRRETMNQAGLLDEQFFWGGEEVDWCYRIKQKAWSIYLLPNARIIHYGGRSIGQAGAGANIIHGYQGRFKFVSKHRGRIYAICLAVVILVDVPLRILLESMHYLVPIQSSRPQIASKVRNWWQVLRLSIMFVRTQLR